jgi:hypothetical protein
VEWKRIATYLRAKGWTLQAIADELDKPYETVRRNTAALPTMGNRRSGGVTNAEP